MGGLLTCEAFFPNYELLNDRVNTLGYNMSANTTLLYITPLYTVH